MNYDHWLPGFWLVTYEEPIHEYEDDESLIAPPEKKQPLSPTR